MSAEAEGSPAEPETSEAPPATDPPQRDASRNDPTTSPASAPIADLPPAVAAPTVGTVRAVILTAVTMIAVNTVTIAATLPLPPQGVHLRGLHHLYDIGHHLAVGLVAAGCVAAWRRFGSSRIVWQRVALAVISLILAIPILRPDLYAFAHRNAPLRWAPLLLAAVTFLGSLGVVAGAELGHRLGRRSRRWAWLGVVLGVTALAFNHRVLRRDYPGVHFYWAFSAAGMVAMSVAFLRLPSWWSRLVRLSPWMLSILVAAFTVVVYPGNILLVELLKVDGAVVAPWIARGYSTGRGNVTVPPAARAWFEDRANLPAVPPSAPRLLPDQPVIVVISLDALRADVTYSGKYDDRLPNLVKLRDESVDFTMARTNGSQTVYSLTTMFTGNYYSQQYWVRHPKHPDLFPHEDKSPRFPKFLTQAGFATVTVAASFWFNNEFGCIGGFTEEIYTKDAGVTKGDDYARAALVMNDVIARLRKQGPGPLFLFSHLLDAHSPYNRGGTRGSEFERYVGELAYVDGELGRLLKALDETGLAPRTTVILLSDHGEAFGEHGARTHGVNLYEELIRIPLFIKIPGVAPRKVTTPVTLADLGPTILDLVGLPTPGYNMGQSLVPFLRGQDPKLHRPNIAETRLKKSLVMDDGFKVIVDDRVNTIEVYDLNADPTETRNLYDGSGSRHAPRVDLMRFFFDTHAIRRPGYVIPYRP